MFVRKYCSGQSLLLTLALLLSLARANAQGHFVGGSFNPNDYFIPPATGWVVSFYYSYTNLDYFNQSGNKTDVIEVSQEPPLYVTIGQKVKTHSIIPMALYFGKGKILNARWGMMALPIINSPSANIALDFYTGPTPPANEDININIFGLGDCYLQPIWLTWEKNKLTTSVSYGLWLPTGKYEAGSAENMGLGYLSHNLRGAIRYKPKPQYTLMAATTFEFNTNQKDVDFKEAPHLTLDYGVSYSFTKGHELGLMGCGMWQLGDDKGEKAVAGNDRMYGLGLYGSYWFKPGKFGVLGRALQNFGTRNRFGGFSFQVGLNFLFLKY
ncbi:transporter [Flavihumibacter rivuli]|uniref:SphA family protein n=1 Tax=Flavihumibacter rivuli TaxID=2838156 RepID=UPI001BDDD404|nr:transporter [Flavihumibacter rivuli]ULQ55815.1 transporter [Flavihumibacter rivuli]